MDSILGVLAVLAALFIIFLIVMTVITRNEDKAKRIESLKGRFNRQQADLKQQENKFESMIQNFFSSSSDSNTYSSTHKTLVDIISEMNSIIEQMTTTNTEIIHESSKQDQSSSISQAYTLIISKANDIANSFKTFGQKVYTLADSKLMDENSYGKVDKAYWDFICSAQRSESLQYIAWCDNLLGSHQFSELFTIDIGLVLNCVWIFAVEKTFSASDYQKATSVFNRIYKYCHADLIISDFYAKKRMGGEDILRDPIRDLLKVQSWPRILTLVASGLMWMNAYRSENTVLQHMLSSGMEMAPKTQERLYSLTNGGGKAPSGYNVQSNEEVLYFDVSALAWKDDEYVGLFENLAFQEKKLSYCLAVRDENKELLHPQGISAPDEDSILNKFMDVFAEEYGTVVVAESLHCIALSGIGKEKVDGILAASTECQQLGILMHIAAIGKKLIIKFYTLFLPTSDDLSIQKQQALSMYKRLSPSVAMWESSLKDTMLIAVEQLLNTTSQSESTQMDNRSTGHDPIF